MEPGKSKKKRTFVGDCRLCGSRRLAQKGVTIITQRSQPKKTGTGPIGNVVLRHNERVRRKERSVKYLRTSKRRKGQGISPGEIQR